MHRSRSISPCQCRIQSNIGFIGWNEWCHNYITIELPIISWHTTTVKAFASTYIHITDRVWLSAQCLLFNMCNFHDLGARGLSIYRVLVQHPVHVHTNMYNFMLVQVAPAGWSGRYTYAGLCLISIPTLYHCGVYRILASIHKEDLTVDWLHISARWLEPLLPGIRKLCLRISIMNNGIFT